MNPPRNLLARIRQAGILPTDSERTQRQKVLLIFATGLVSFAAILWGFLYWELCPDISSTVPFVFQLLLAGNLALYLKTLNFEFFRQTQLALFLFMPFVAQWSMGNVITSSGMSLWALLAPVGAVLVIGAREALAWFFAYVFLTALSGGFDYYQSDIAQYSLKIPPEMTVFFFALNFTAVSTLIFVLLRYAALERQKAQSRLEETYHLLQQEQEHSERLLLNILPGPIAERLKHSNQTIADGFSEVSVMFVDIVNFTHLAEGMTPLQVFSMLNRVFSSFDELAEEHGLEKIKTIGDAYMVAAGLNDQREDFTDALVELALEIRDLVQWDFQKDMVRIEVRIGIGSGPVVAGVVGKKKFIYDLWGDTVNLASRITDEGLPGIVQVDEASWRKLRDRFDFRAPRSLYLRGKGNTTVYSVVGKKRAQKDTRTVDTPRQGAL